MKNPLPATLYVTFHNQSQYEILQRTLNENADIILNVQDFSQIDSIQQQEARVLNIIKLSNFVQIVCYVLVLVLVAVILSFAIFFLRGIFTTFRNDMQVKKLLGATKTQIIQPFMWAILSAIIGGFVLSLVFTVVSLGVFDYYMAQVFEGSLLSHLLENWVLVVEVFAGEVVGIIALLTVVSYIFVSELHKKLKKY
jgi:cell division protein FtsX